MMVPRRVEKVTLNPQWSLARGEVIISEES
jgi:hypothetical protein